MNILVTGGCGFIASNFINYIFKNQKEQINKIVNIDALYYCSNVNNINEDIRKSKMYEFIHANCSDSKKMYSILEKESIDIILHFAAQSFVDNSFDNSRQFIEDNIIGTHSLLMASLKYGKLKKFVYISTDEVYGESEFEDIIPKSENSTFKPTNPYAASKAGAELLCYSFYKSYNLPLIITRANNVFGINQYPEKLIPRFIKLLGENEKLTIHGSGKYKRTFLYVDDFSDALLLLINKNDINGEIFNIGSDNEYSILDIAKTLITLIKGETDDFDSYLVYTKDRNYNDKRYFIDYNKIKKLGWEPKMTLISGLKKIIDKKN